MEKDTTNPNAFEREVSDINSIQPEVSENSHLSVDDLESEPQTTAQEENILMDEEVNEPNPEHADEPDPEDVAEPNPDNASDGILQDNDDDYIPTQAQQQQTAAANLEDNLFSLVSSIGSSHLISEESIDALKELLCPKQPAFDNLSLKDPKLSDKLLELIREKSTKAHSAIGDALNFYHKMLVESQIHHLDKLIRIIKSKKREIHLRRTSNAPKYIEFPSVIPHECSKPEKSDDDKMESDIHEHKESPNDDDAKKRVESDFGDSIMENPMDIMNLLDQTQLGSMILKKKVLPEYNPLDKSIKFEVNDKYEVKLKIADDVSIVQKSRLDVLPVHILQTSIFPYLSSIELFSLRAVCNEWRDMIRGMWHIIFKREMLEQIVAAELCNEIEMHFKLMQIRTPFYQKFGVFMKALIEMLDWARIEEDLQQQEGMDKRVKILLITLMKMLGCRIDIDRLVDYEECHWNEIKDISSNELRLFMNRVLEAEFSFICNSDLEKIKKGFLDAPDISSHNVRELGDKNYVFLFLFLRQLYVFGHLKNNLAISQRYALLAKERLKEVSKGWSPKKGFLEGAYKILLFRYVKISNNDILISKDDNDDGGMGELKKHILQDSRGENTTTNNQHSLIPESERSQTMVEESKFSNGITPAKNTDRTEDSALATQDKGTGTTEDNQETLETQEKPDQNAQNKEEENDSQDRNDLETGLFGVDQNFEGVQDLGSQDLETSLNNLIKDFVQKSKTREPGAQTEPDYIIRKHGTETRIFLDDETRLEILIQKFLKFHLLTMHLKQLNERHNELKEQLSINEQKQRDLQNTLESQERDVGQPDDLTIHPETETLNEPPLDQASNAEPENNKNIDL